MPIEGEGIGGSFRTKRQQCVEKFPHPFFKPQKTQGFKPSKMFCIEKVAPRITSSNTPLFGNRIAIHHFLRERIIIITTSAITAITIKTPKPMPALNMPAIASHELINTDISNNVNKA